MKYIYGFLGITAMIAMFSCNGNKDSIKQTTITIKNRTDSNVWVFDKVVGQTVYFKSNKSFKTNLYDLKYIGQLYANNKAPYLILSGRSCTECDENISIFIYSPTDGPMKS